MTTGEMMQFSCCILQRCHPRGAVKLCFGDFCCHVKRLLDLFQFTSCAWSCVTLLWFLRKSTKNVLQHMCSRQNLEG